MKFNKKNMTAGVVGLGLVGALVTGGVAAAQAATGDGMTAQPPSTTSSTVDDHQSGHDHESDHESDHMSGHQSGHMTGMAFGQRSPMTAVASYLGLSQTELRDRVQSGESLADVAAAEGKSVSGLEDAMGMGLGSGTAK